jgi:DNA replication protein DnaC
MTATKTARRLDEAIAAIAQGLGLNPQLPDVKQIRAREQREAIDFLNRYHAGSYGVQDSDELERDLSKYRFAAKYQDCENGCKGLKACKLSGYKPFVVIEDYFGKRFFATHVGECNMLRGSAAQAKTNELLEASRIPKHLVNCTFASYRTPNRSAETAKNQALSAAEYGNSLILMGDPGVGKTHLAVAIVQHTISRGRSAVFAPVVTLLDTMKSAIDTNRVDDIMRDLRHVDCLVLDDIGTQKDTSWTGERLYEIINTRYNDKSQVVVTVNASNPNELQAQIGVNGPQIESRLCEMGAVYCIRGSDYRKRGRAAA